MARFLGNGMELIGYRRAIVDSDWIPVYQLGTTDDPMYQIGIDFGIPLVVKKRPKIDLSVGDYNAMHSERPECRFSTLEKINAFLSDPNEVSRDDFIGGVMMTALLRYYGSKWRMANWIVSTFPPQDMYDCFVDGFGGSGAITFAAPHSPTQVYNDLDSLVWNFMDVLRRQTDDLVDAIMYTPYSRFELEQCIVSEWDKLDPLEKARRFYVLSWQGRGMRSASTRTKAGWRYRISINGQYPPNDFYDADDIFMMADRIRDVQIDNDEIKNVIRRYDSPKTLFYLDPPYIDSTGERNAKNNGYNHEMPEWAHRDMLELVLKSEGFFVISGYRSSLYADTLGHWECLKKDGMDDRNNLKTECLWLSPNITAIQQRMFQ